MSEILDTVKEVGKDISETIKERLFSPMYFYFIIAWLVTNWQFVFSFFALDQKYISILKVDYLASFYQFDSILGATVSMLKLIILPAFYAFAVVWWLSILSEKFYAKTYQHQMNKEAVKRRIDYQEKTKLREDKNAIRGSIFDSKSLVYQDNPEFNEYLDQLNPDNVVVSEIEMVPSEVLYNTDYQAYVDLYDDYIESAKDSHYETQADIARGK